MKATAKESKGKGRTAKASADDDTQDQADEQGFLPKAQQLGSQAFADGTKVMEEASNFIHTMQKISHEAEGSLRAGMKSNPWAVLGGAATVGFVLGRGLTFGTSRTLLGMGGKLAMSMLIKRVTHGVLS